MNTLSQPFPSLLAIQRDGRLLSLAVFCLAFLWYFHLALRLSPASFHDRFHGFSADSDDTMEFMLEVSFKGDMRKHILFSPVATCVTQGLGLAGIKYPTNLLVAIAFLGALNLGLIYLLFLRLSSRSTLSLLLTTAYGVMFANTVLFSIPETFAMSNLMLVTYLLCLAGMMEHLTLPRCLLLSAIAGLAALFHMTLGMLIVIHIFVACASERIPTRTKFAIAASSVLVASTIFAGVIYGLHGPGYLEYSGTYATHWASIRNFADPGLWSGVLADFFFFSIATPIADVPKTMGANLIVGYFESPIGTLLFLLILAASMFCLRGIATKSNALIRGLALWMGLFTVFHVYFNPTEAILYSCHILLPMVLVCFLSLKEHIGTDLRSHLAIVPVVLLLFINNYGAISTMFQ
jgi:hypothetical protein